MFTKQDLKITNEIFELNEDKFNRLRDYLVSVLAISDAYAKKVGVIGWAHILSYLGEKSNISEKYISHFDFRLMSLGLGMCVAKAYRFDGGFELRYRDEYERLFIERSYEMAKRYLDEKVVNVLVWEEVNCDVNE